MSAIKNATTISMIALAAGTFLGSSVATAESVLFVDDTAAGTNDGSNWCNAFMHLQDALAAALAADGAITEIRVARGTYQPDRDTANPGGTGEREATFHLINGVTVRGGYAGCGADDPDEQDLDAYQTVLSGDLAEDDNNCCTVHESSGCEDPSCTDAVCTADSSCCVGEWSLQCAELVDGLCDILCNSNDENSYHVVTAGNTDATAELDSLVVTGGNANSATPHNGGAGMLNDNSAATVTNCIFAGNSAQYGGAVYNINGSTPRLVGCTFMGNSASHSGGGMYNEEPDNDPQLTDCTFKGNTAAVNGGGIYNGEHTAATLANCRFVGNVAESFGGGVYSFWWSRPELTDCRLEGNSAVWGGGGMCNVYSSPTVQNSVFSGNSASRGGGVYSDIDVDNWPVFVNCTLTGNTTISEDGAGVYTLGSDSRTVLRNCILAGNIKQTDWPDNHQDAQIAGTAPDIEHSCIEPCTTLCQDPNLHNIGENPLFVDADGPDAVYGTEDDDLHLLPGSPCIDAGDNPTVTVLLDPDGNPRFVDDVCTNNSGHSDPQRPQLAIVDMGAYEFQELPTDDVDGDQVSNCDDNCPAHSNPNQEDCDDDNIGDVCALASGLAKDCNTNDHPDGCDIADCPSEDPSCRDCNDNGVPDGCDIEDGTLTDGNGDGVPDQCSLCIALLSSSPPNCAIDARQPSWPDGSNTAGWGQIELTFNAGCDTATLVPGGFAISVLPDGAPPTIDNLVRVDNVVTMEFSPFIELTKWTCFSHTNTTGEVCLGYLPGNVNSDSTSSPAIDLSALIDCLNAPGTCANWRQNINRDTAVGVADLTRLIDLFNGAAAYDNWAGGQIAVCPSQP